MAQIVGCRRPSIKFSSGVVNCRADALSIKCRLQLFVSPNFNISGDGVERCSLRIEARLSKWQYEMLKKHTHHKTVNTELYMLLDAAIEQHLEYLETQE